jgi:septum formation protein
MPKLDADNERIYLASASPRRRELFALTGWTARIIPAEVDETYQPGEKAGDYVIRMATTKAKTAASVLNSTAVIIAADTIVLDGDQVLGKPANEREAQNMLITLRAHKHKVFTAIALIKHDMHVVDFCETGVPMLDYDHDTVEKYVASGSPLDKAGAYGIQDREFLLVDVEQMRDCYANVMGLPICNLVRSMRRFGEKPLQDVPIACQNHTRYDCRAHLTILRGVS